MRRIRFDLYSSGHLNTTPQADEPGRRPPESCSNGRDTPRLYALYSDVFSGHLHTNSARKPYCRKGFRKCIQCIQRIPTPFVFRFSPLLGREYMNTVNTIGRRERLPCGVFGWRRTRRFCIQRDSRIRSGKRAKRGRERPQRSKPAPKHLICIQCIQLYSAAICIQIRLVSPTPVRDSEFVFSVFSVFRPPSFFAFLSF